MAYFIYCLTNDVYKKINLYKIGYTNDLEKRKSDLKSTGVAGGSFYVVELRTVDTEPEAIAWENYVHTKLCEYRYTFDREFFEIKDLNILKPFFNNNIMEEINKNETTEPMVLNVQAIYDVRSEDVISRIENIRREGESISNLKAKKRAYKGNEAKWGFSEFFDNAKDCHPLDGIKRKFKISYNANGHLIIQNNCPGFKSKKDFERFLKNDIYHIERGVETIGFNGGGWKDAIRALADYEANKATRMCDVIIITSYDGIIAFKTIWHICEDEKRYLKYDEIVEVPANGFIGTLTDIEYPVSYKFDDVEEYFRTTYSQKIFSELFDIEIAMNYKHLRRIDSFKNPMYLDELGDNINKPGLYLINNKFFVVRHHMMRNDEKNEIIKFKTITLFLPAESNVNHTKRNGIFEMFGQKYLGEPKIHPNQQKFSKGQYYTNCLVIYDDVKTAYAFGVREIKNEGGLLFGNADLDKFKNEEGKNPSEVITEAFEESETNIYRLFKKYEGQTSCLEDTCKFTFDALNNKNVIVPILSNEDIEKNKATKKEKDKSEKEEYLNRLEKAIEEYNNLPEEEKNRLDVKYKYTSNFCTVLKISNPLEGSKKIKDLKEYFRIMPWSLINDIFKEKQFELYYYVLTKGYTSFKQTNPSMETLLNDYVKRGYAFYIGRKESCIYKSSDYVTTDVVYAETN